jgi:RND superfamily putative drug exporter
MQNAMLRLDGAIRRHQRAVLTVWALVLVGAVPFAMQQSEHLSSGGFTVPGSQSDDVTRTLARDYPQLPKAFLGAVLVPQAGATPQQVQAAYARVAKATREVDGLKALPTTFDPAEGARRGGPLIVAMTPTVSEDAATDVAVDLREELAIGEVRGGVRTHLIGQGALWSGMQELSKSDLEKAEATGFPIVLLILLAVFGSFAAAALPLGLGLVSVLVTGALIFFLSQAMDMSVFVTNMASMVGIGVAVDYSLFVLARYREEVRTGRTPDEARAAAMATSGVVVLFSGLTVIVSLAGLWLVDNNALRSMALGAILVVGVSMLASATLLPALIRALGARVYSRQRLFTVMGLVARSWGKRRRGSTNPDAPVRDGFWVRWTARVTRRPALWAVGAATVLLVLAIPTLSMQTGAGALDQFPAGHETRVGMETAAKLAGPGGSAPVRITVEDASEAAEVRRVLEAEPGIASVDGVERASRGGGALITATPAIDGESEAAKAMVLRLRDALPQADVGGVSASQEDIASLISGSMWKILLFVLGLSYLVLLVLLRSVILPLKAVMMNLLSVGAAYGVLVAVFQWGWLDGFMGFQSTGHLDTLTPPLVLAVVFGLSMDYEVFLLSRIRERYDAHGNTERAVAEGLAASARTITSAALIMVAVFAVFVGTGVPSIKQIGLGNAVAIAVDATLVRLILVPAAMELLGKWNWYLPAWLDRRLPQSSFEELEPGVLGEPAPPEVTEPAEREPALA